MHRFSIIIDMLQAAFESHVNENEYHQIVRSLRAYQQEPDPPSVQIQELRNRRWPLSYNPCDHMENIRFSLQFVPSDQCNVGVQVALNRFRCTQR